MAIDISSPTAFEREATGQGSVSQLLSNVGKLEGIRRDRDILDQYVTELAKDPTADPAQIIAGLSEPQFAPGLLGQFQRIAGGFEGGQGTVLPQLQAGLFQTPLQRARTEAIRTAKVTPPFKKTPEETARDSDMGFLDKQGKKTPAERNTGQIKAAQDRLKALPEGTLFSVDPGAFDEEFVEVMKQLKPEMIRVQRVLGFSDKVFGKESFDLALKAVINEGLKDGINPADMEREFTAWWNRQAEKEKGQRFQKFQPTSEFTEATPGETARPTTQAEFDAIPKGTIFIDTDGTRVRK